AERDQAGKGRGDRGACGPAVVPVVPEEDRRARQDRDDGRDTGQAPPLLRERGLARIGEGGSRKSGIRRGHFRRVDAESLEVVVAPESILTPEQIAQPRQYRQ